MSTFKKHLKLSPIHPPLKILHTDIFLTTLKTKSLGHEPDSRTRKSPSANPAVRSTFSEVSREIFPWNQFSSESVSGVDLRENENC